MDLQALRKTAIEHVKDQLRNSVKDDILIIQTISNIEEIDKSTNLLSKRVREWYELYDPETSHDIEDHEEFIKKILPGKAKQTNSMGADLPKKDLTAIFTLAEHVKALFDLRNKELDYLEFLMDKECPNIKVLTGATIGAKLISIAGSLHRLSRFPASTIQLLGAEKALFRHLKNKKNRPPKFGILHEHSMVVKVPNKNRGKMARTLADKISIAAKVDAFKGKYVGNTLLKQIEKKFNELK